MWSCGVGSGRRYDDVRVVGEGTRERCAYCFPFLIFLSCNVFLWNMTGAVEAVGQEPGIILVCVLLCRRTGVMFSWCLVLPRI